MRHAKHVLRIAGAIVVVSFGVIAAAACDDDEVTLLSIEEYFARTEAIEEDADRRADDLGREVDLTLVGDLVLDDERRDALMDGYRQFSGILDEFVRDLRALDPPAEASDAHGEYIDAVEELGDAFDALAERVADADSLDDALGLFGAVQAPADAAEAACLRLERVAKDNDIDADLECGDD